MIGKWDLTPKQFDEMPALNWDKVKGYHFFSKGCCLDRPNGGCDLVIVIPYGSSSDHVKDVLSQMVKD